MAWSSTAKQGTLKIRGSSRLAGLSDLVGSLGKENTKFYELEVAEVLDICLDSEHEAFKALGGYSNGAIGQIKIRLLHSKPKDLPGNYEGGTLGRALWARPLFSNIKTYPLKREYVIVGQYLSKLTPNSEKLFREYYYSSPVSLFGSINANALLLERPSPTTGNGAYTDTEGGHEKIAGEDEKISISLVKFIKSIG